MAEVPRRERGEAFRELDHRAMSESGEDHVLEFPELRGDRAR